MTDEDITKKPGVTVGDAAHASIRATLSAIPFGGGTAVEIFSAIIAPPLSRRRDEWIQSIAEGLRKLQERVDGFSVEALAENEVFVSTALNASQAAVRTHQREKLTALRNAVLNAALPDAADEDLQLIFLHFIDEFTPWHIRVLKVLHDLETAGKPCISEGPEGESCPQLEEALPELQERPDFRDQLVNGLLGRGLVFKDILPSDRRILFYHVDPIAVRFLEFITSPEALEDE